MSKSMSFASGHSAIRAKHSQEWLYVSGSRKWSLHPYPVSSNSAPVLKRPPRRRVYLMDSIIRAVLPSKSKTHWFRLQVVKVIILFFNAPAIIIYIIDSQCDFLRSSPIGCHFNKFYLHGFIHWHFEKTSQDDQRQESYLQCKKSWENRMMIIWRKFKKSTGKK